MGFEDAREARAGKQKGKMEIGSAWLRGEPIMVNRGVNKVGPALKTLEGACLLACGTVGSGLGA